MEKIYSNTLTKSNILFGIHCLFKGTLILLLFIILYSIIWIKEKYLNYLKISVYIQLLIFLFLITIILIINNPNFFDICFKCNLYIFLILSILQIIIIIIELLGTIKNFKNFIIFFHECPFYRSYNDIIESKYQRTCLFYNEDSYAEDQYKYICFYNSEEEYYNKFCDGLFCQKNYNFYNDENDFTKCTGININLISFPQNNIYFQKEQQLFDKKKNKKIYLCSRKKRLDELQSENNNDSKYNHKNIECPDNNPSVKYVVFIYIEIILHILVDFLFIFEYFVVKNLNTLYLNMVKESQLQIPTKTVDYHPNSSNNRVNTPSANEIIVNIKDKKQLNYPDEINSEYDEDIKEENSSGIIENGKNDNNRHKRKLKMEINDNRPINIVNPNQHIKICKDKNDGSLLLNALKSPKKRGNLKPKKFKNKQNVPKLNQNEDFMEDKDKKHYYLKSSQLQNLINISMDNDENNDNIQTKIKEKIKNKNISETNGGSLNNNNENIENTKKENEKNSKELYVQNLINIDDNKSKLEVIKHNNLKMSKNINKEKITHNKNNLIKKHNENNDINILRQMNVSFNGKNNKLEEKKNVEKNERNDDKINKKNLIENIHINSEVFLNDEELEDEGEQNKKNELDNNKIT